VRKRYPTQREFIKASQTESWFFEKDANPRWPLSAGLYPVSKILTDLGIATVTPAKAGVQILDSGTRPGCRSGAGRNDDQHTLVVAPRIDELVLGNGHHYWQLL
jgi:hypothetical protein